MTHAEIRRALAERLRALLGAHQNLPISLRPYQLETLRAILSLLEDPEGSRRGYVEHATGLGKTVLFAALAGFCTDLRVLIVVPSLILVEQTARAAVKFTGGMLGYLGSNPSVTDERGQVIAMRGHKFSNVVVTTDESFARSPRRIAEEFNPHLIVFDECHWAYTGKSSWALTLFPESVIIGFSATPDYLTTTARSDYTPVALDNGQTLYAPPARLAQHEFGTLIDKRTVPWGVSQGWLAPLAWSRVEFDVSLDGLPVNEGEGGMDYQVNALTRYMEQEWWRMMRAIRRVYGEGRYGLANRQVFAVCPSVVAANELARAISELGVSSACITGHTPGQERHRILRAYARNEVRLLTSVMVLREGWDAPNAEVCLMMRPTKSRVLYVQAVGRVLRPSPDGKDKVALVLDGHFRDTIFQPLSAPVLFAPVGRTMAMGEIILQVNQGAAGPARPVKSPYVVDGADTYTVEPIALEHHAGKDGTFVDNGEIWGSERGLAKKLGVDIHYIQTWVIHSKARTRVAKTETGQTATFYALSDVVAAAHTTGYHSDVQSGAIADRAKAALAEVRQRSVAALPAPKAVKEIPAAVAQPVVIEKVVPSPVTPRVSAPVQLELKAPVSGSLVVEKREVQPEGVAPPWAAAGSGWGQVIEFRPRPVRPSPKARPVAAPATVVPTKAKPRKKTRKAEAQSDLRGLRRGWISAAQSVLGKIQRRVDLRTQDRKVRELLRIAKELARLERSGTRKVRRKKHHTLRVKNAKAAGEDE